MKRSLTPIVALALCGASAAGAQEPAAPVFGETVEVRVVNLEVVVTDRDGLPVTGLAAEDFVLRVDGEEVKIDYFTEVRGGQAVEVESGREAGIGGIPDLVPGTPVGTSYLVFIDDFFAILRDRDKVLRTLMDDLSRLGPEDRMAIVAWDGNRLDMISTWSSSPPELERALRRALTRKSHGLERVAESRAFIADRRLSRGLRVGRTGRSFDTRLDLTERQYAALLEQQVGNVVSAAAATLRAFANPPGRKVMLLLSGGWPYDPVDYAAGTFAGAYQEPGIRRGDELYAPLVATANQVGYTIYPVDVPGLVGDVGRDASTGGAVEIEGPTETFTSETITQWALRHLADETGGRALINADRTRALEAVEADTRTYYWLGFVPQWQGDDRDHELRVEARQAGLEVRGRAGFVDLSRRSETSMIVESVLIFGNGPGVGMLDLTTREPKRSGIGRMLVPIRIAVPATEITFLPQGDKLVAQLELRVAAIDQSGGRSDVPVLPIQLQASRAPNPGELASYETTLELRSMKNRIAVALYDASTGAIWSATADVEP